MSKDIAILAERQDQVGRADGSAISCGRHSTAGAVTQRACVFCGSRVVLYPITDALHIVHGPVGCAAYTWDIRGSLSSGRELHRLGFSTDLREREVVFGGEKKLRAALDELIAEHKPAGAFIYSTCLAGVIGDDVDAVCKAASTRHGIPVIPVQAPGFAGTKITGYRVACDALATLVGTGDTSTVPAGAINILGDFNLAGELWTIKSYYQVMGVPIISTITGDARINDIRRAHGAALNVVQCSGSMIHLARDMERRFGIPYIQVSYVGFEDTAAALYAVAEKLVNTDAMQRAQELVRNEVAKVTPELRRLKKLLAGRTVALYTGGAFKALSLVRALRSLGMRTVLAGCQTGGDQDYQELQRLCDPDTVIVDDITTHELGRFLARGGVDLFIGGVKERPLAYKLGIAFCDHNHERKHGLAGFDGMLTFAEEVFSSVSSPVWKLPVTRGEMG